MEAAIIRYTVTLAGFLAWMGYQHYFGDGLPPVIATPAFPFGVFNPAAAVAVAPVVPNVGLPAQAPVPVGDPQPLVVVQNNAEDPPMAAPAAGGGKPFVMNSVRSEVKTQIQQKIAEAYNELKEAHAALKPLCEAEGVDCPILPEFSQKGGKRKRNGTKKHRKNRKY